MDTSSVDTGEVQDVWTRVFGQVRREIDVPTVWLAMQAVVPLGISGSFFVAALPLDMQFLRINLESAETSTVIEEALREATGRVLAFRLIRGQTLADWEQEKGQENLAPAPSRIGATTLPPPPSETTFTPPPTRPVEPPRPTFSQAPSDREVFPTWEKLNDWIAHSYKAAPLIKYHHGQARYLMDCIQHISDTMDVLMPASGQPRDETQERNLAKTLDRLGNIMSQLDPLFIALELLRYRQSQGKDIGI